MRQRYHGGSMIGNDCCKLQSAQLLSNLIPKRQQHARAQHRARRKPIVTASRYDAIHELIKLIDCFNVVVSQTMALRLHPHWRKAINALSDQFETFEQSIVSYSRRLTTNER